MKCRICGSRRPFLPRVLPACPDCLRNRPEETLPLVRKAHAEARVPYHLPPEPPRSVPGSTCTQCLNACTLSEGESGFCGTRKAVGGEMQGGEERGNCSWYHDPLPTNCVADWVCPGGTGAGYPRHAHRTGPETGYRNLAVFAHSCSFDCLFCQNWHYRNVSTRPEVIAPEQLVRAVDGRTSCICYFGGDPTPQLPFFLTVSRKARERNPGILRICWETNGSMEPALLLDMISLSLESGGCIKFDLKAWDDHLHRALTGVSNRNTLRNIRETAAAISRRPDPPLLIVSTLMVPGYIDAGEVRQIAGFLASLDPGIPYALLAFHPQFLLSDLPPTSRREADECLAAAREAGLTNIRIGNLHLLR